MLHHCKPEKCIDCECCNVTTLTCHPNDTDCKAEYDLTEEDLVTPQRCDFFKPKQR